MGLDITAYSKVELVKPLTNVNGKINWDDELSDDDDIARIYGFDFPERLGDTVPGYYRYASRTSWKDQPAWSYGGYNRFREVMSLTVLGVSPETVWDNYKKYKDKPLAPLIHFSDCEGSIGAKHCQRIAKDLAEWYDHLLAACEGPYYKEQLAKLLRCFEIASDGGCVVFH